MCELSLQPKTILLNPKVTFLSCLRWDLPSEKPDWILSDNKKKKKKNKSFLITYGPMAWELKRKTNTFDKCLLPHYVTALMRHTNTAYKVIDNSVTLFVVTKYDRSCKFSQWIDDLKAKEFNCQAGKPGKLLWPTIKWIHWIHWESGHGFGLHFPWLHCGNPLSALGG